MSEKDPFAAAADEEFERAKAEPGGARRNAPADASDDGGATPFGRPRDAAPHEREREATVRGERAPTATPSVNDAPRDRRPSDAHPSEADPTGERFREGEFANEPGWFEPGPRNAQLCYWLNLAGFVITPLPIISAGMAFAMRGRVSERLATHYTYAMRTALLVILYGLTVAVLLGRSAGLGLLLVVVWFAYRNLRGLARVGSGQPIPDPRSWIT